MPGGTALAVDREIFSRAVHERVTVASQHHRGARGGGRAALAGDRRHRAAHLRRGWPRRSPPGSGSASLAFYDAIAPVVADDSLDHDRLYALSRYGKGEGDDYLNAPMDARRLRALHRRADRGRPVPGPRVRRRCPTSRAACRWRRWRAAGRETLRFGPMKPVGLPDPRTGREPHAVVQLRREDRAGQMWNLVGFQTRLRIPEQQRVFRMIPGLEDAEFLRFGSIHRNAYLNSPASLGTGAHRARRRPALLRRADHRRRGLHRVARHRPPRRHQPRAAACRATRSPSRRRPRCSARSTATSREADPKHFQPMNANFGLLEPLAAGRIKKDRKKELLVERAQADFAAGWRRSGEDGSMERRSGVSLSEAKELRAVHGTPSLRSG